GTLADCALAGVPSANGTAARLSAAAPSKWRRVWSTSLEVLIFSIGYSPLRPDLRPWVNGLSTRPIRSYTMYLTSLRPVNPSDLIAYDIYRPGTSRLRGTCEASREN